MKKPLTITIDEDLRKRLEAIAEREKRSLSNLVEIFIEEAIARREQPANLPDHDREEQRV